MCLLMRTLNSVSMIKPLDNGEVSGLSYQGIVFSASLKRWTFGGLRIEKHGPVSLVDDSLRFYYLRIVFYYASEIVHISIFLVVLPGRIILDKEI